MRELPTIEHAPDLLRRVSEGARVTQRVTVKAVIRQGERLLLLHSSAWDCFKFAGGGMEAGETEAATLTRELREELGAELLRFGPLLLRVCELSAAQEDTADVFRMDSLYHACEVRLGQHSPAPEAYEAALGLTPRWVTPAEAAATNLEAMRRSGSPRWLRREVEVLRALKHLM